ncbi:MAG TPA: GNAT family N-acetyltransferase [Flavipsychrobacter sp.]|nr:GNAT family N-acetyltransferase [Flavipsychrobacter sp.]
MFPNKYAALAENEFVSGICKIVPVRYEDRLRIMKWRNEQIYHLRQQRVLTETDQDNYFRNVVAGLFELEQPDQLLFSYLENDVCIGYGGLVHINWMDRNAEISFLIQTESEQEGFHKHWGIYLDLIEQVAFTELKLHKLFTYAFDVRPHLYEAIERKSYKKEAVLKDHCYFHGTYKDVVIHTKIKHTVTIRKADEIDVTITHLWANDDLTRKNSYSSEAIPFETHEKWWRSKMTDENALYYICEAGGADAGIIRFDKDTHTGCYVIGVTIAPDFRGKKLTGTFLKVACTAFFAKHPEAVIDAYIKEENTASIKAFENAHFIYSEPVVIKGIRSVKYQLKHHEA